MSITVEDLVSSLSSSHIGQEAIDIATLQAQLAQTLFGQPSSSSTGRQVPRTYTQPCNTPTARTRSASFSSWGQMASDQQFMANVSNPNSRVTDEYSRNNDDMEDDERMVEELLIPSSPMSTFPTPSPSHHYMSPNSYAPPASPSYFTASTHSTHPPVSEPASSLFTSTDPFYMAQVQAAQNYSSQQQSLFAQSGSPSQASPFIRQQQFYQHNNRRENHGYIHPNAPSLTLDTHTFFAQTSAAF